jgi:hypothetical protein
MLKLLSCKVRDGLAANRQRNRLPHRTLRPINKTPPNLQQPYRAIIVVASF